MGGVERCGLLLVEGRWMVRCSITLEDVGLFNFNGKFVDVLLNEEGGADLRIELGSPSTTCELMCKALVHSIAVT